MNRAISVFWKITVAACWCGTIFGNNNVIYNETILASCQYLGNSLYNQCVTTPVATPEQFALCASLKTSYVICITLLSNPYYLEPASGVNYNEFSPCSYKIAQLILNNICP